MALFLPECRGDRLGEFDRIGCDFGSVTGLILTKLGTER